MRFETDDARNLPVSTTKGALDIDEAVYVQAKNAVMEALRSLITYTNRVKGVEEQTDQQVEAAPSLSVAELVTRLAPVARSVRNSGGTAKKLQPKLPEPPRSSPRSRISFSRDRAEVEEVVDLLGLPSDTKPGDVGETVWIAHAKSLKIID
jgi:hypothetical protein